MGLLSTPTVMQSSRYLNLFPSAMSNRVYFCNWIREPKITMNDVKSPLFRGVKVHCSEPPLYVHIRQQRNKRFPLCEALKYTKDANGARTKGLKTDKKTSRDFIVIIISTQLRQSKRGLNTIVLWNFN